MVQAPVWLSSRLGKTWPRPGGHSSWGHPHVTLTRSFPRRYILGSSRPRPIPGN